MPNQTLNVTHEPVFWAETTVSEKCRFRTTKTANHPKELADPLTRLGGEAGEIVGPLNAEFVIRFGSLTSGSPLADAKKREAKPLIAKFDRLDRNVQSNLLFVINYFRARCHAKHQS